MNRRQILLTAAALAAPRLHAQPASVLRYVPANDLAVLDPILTTAYVTRNHGMMVFDTLYGLDSQLRPQPQMAQGHVVEEDGLRWTITLRPGLRFHDGAPVLARDCVASIRRWAVRDPMGRMMMARTAELSAPDDRSIVFRLRKPFAPLAEALGKIASPICAMMPERLAQTDPNRPVAEVIGSGPYRFLMGERMPGARAAYARFAGYRPREDAEPDWTAGPKHAHFDRVEWITMPDQATGVAALRNQEVDWMEAVAHDLIPVLRRIRDVNMEVLNPLGSVSSAHFNTLHPPTDNPAIRRAILSAVDQAAFMSAAAGADRQYWTTGVGVWGPGTPLESTAGMEVLNGPRDIEASRRALREAGYAGERMVVLAQTDSTTSTAAALVGADLFRRLGLNIDLQSMDWGTVVQRRASKEPLDRGGWSVFFTGWSPLDWASPPLHASLRGGGLGGYFGWFDSPRMEALAEEWLEAPDPAAQRRIGDAMQVLGLEQAPFLPLGRHFQPTAYRRSLTGVLKGLPLFWNVRRA